MLNAIRKPGAMIIVSVTFLALPLSAFGQVDLVFSPTSGQVLQGDTIEIGLIARSATAANVEMAGIQAILNWDGTKLVLEGNLDNGPYSWLTSELPLFGLATNINASFTDGDAYYEATPPFAVARPLATPSGLLVTTFIFRAVGPANATQISMPLSDGLLKTLVVDISTNDVLGTTGITTIQVLPDCNGNGIEDSQDIASGLWFDCNQNGILDKCEIDLNSVALGGPFFCLSNCATDCNSSGVPDECEISATSTAPGGPFFCTTACSPDCNNDGIPDSCQGDCNCNGIADAIDIANCAVGDLTCADCNLNGRPDGCELDCNANSIPDDCDLANGLPDANGNGVLDACENPCTDARECDDSNVCTMDDCTNGLCAFNRPAIYGDVDRDGSITAFDVFCVLDGFQGDFSGCPLKDSDIEPCAGDGTLTAFDVFAVLNAFQGVNPCCP